ncbi:precorrin-6y C5,15-methyltransferase (decarboxylating) subunit CbiE [Tropicimonas sp. IMCC34043]|uniref:precorrin-6y C5,15-methyltransferase (decarboxylating) subunit CbiE n=1 Tax=Tropicimonas sp. IMCC34043 TaxID=2248760 RepID=UPI000E269978|nr:precorrin-6y C5,15-methyltransferase (decarboxylating) subunit CbiE [Tropicimonas sp. IMCC34043]
MTKPWLDIVGIGHDGWHGISPQARARLEAAEVIVASPRHHALVPDLPAERLEWPHPFGMLGDEIAAMRGRRVAVLVTGDPLWFSAGSLFLRRFDPEELTFYPNLSSFQLASARMKWSLADVETVTLHGRPAEQALPFFGHGLRLLILAQNGETPAKVAAMLTEVGLGPSRLTVLADMGAPEEARLEGRADSWEAAAPDFHVLAVDCRASAEGAFYPRTGLPDDAFIHDGLLTKREVRRITLSALAPRRGQQLWDIGIGCGSVAIEWMRADRDMQAIGIDSSTSRLAMAAANSMRLGAPRLDLRKGKVPEAMSDLPPPDAVFIGGGLSTEVVDIAFAALHRRGRLVANAVTLESAMLLAELHDLHGGELTRIDIARATPVGNRRGWKPFMPVTQWCLVK